MYIPDINLMFVHIQKTGGTAVSKALGQDTVSADKHWTAIELREAYGHQIWQNAYKVAFVRNPWDRLVSWWSMIDGHRSSFTAGAPVNNFFGYILANAATFEDFLNCREDIHDRDGRKCIYRNQIDYLRTQEGEVLVDFIGRFENLPSDFDAICNTVLGRSIELKKVNASEHRHYSTYYTPAMAAQVEQLYARDIEFFGYRFEQGA